MGRRERMVVMAHTGDVGAESSIVTAGVDGSVDPDKILTQLSELFFFSPAASEAPRVAQATYAV